LEGARGRMGNEEAGNRSRSQRPKAKGKKYSDE